MHLVGPAGDDEQIGVGQGQLVADQERAVAEPLVDVVELLAEIAA